MKKLFVVLLSFSLLLCGCQEVPVAEEIIQPQESEQPSSEASSEVPNHSYTQQPMLCVSVPAVYSYVMDENDNHIFTCTHQSMQLTLDEPEVADKIIIDFLNRVSAHDQQANTILQQAYQDIPLEIPYGYEYLYSPTRIDQNVLSLYGIVQTYTGGIHPDHNSKAANYSMITGDVLTLGSILTDIHAIEPLYQLILQNLEQNKSALQLIGGYEQIVYEYLVTDESYNEEWFFSSTGLCFFFPPYEIAPYAVGTVVVEIPYESLTGIIADDFFPPESDYAQGTISVVNTSNAKINNFSQIAEVTIDENGESFLLYTDGMVYDLRVEAGTWNENATVFTPTYTAFAARTLSPGDAVIVQAYFNDVLPTLRLICTSGSETICVYVHQSGEDGSIYLSDQ